MKKVLTYTIMLLIITLFSGCAQKEDQIEWTQINWQLQGAWVNADGMVGSKVPVSFSGRLPKEACKDVDIHVTNVSIDFPEDFPYQHEPDSEISVICVQSVDETGLFKCNGFADDQGKADSVKTTMLTFYLCPQKQQILFVWGGETGRCFVASTDTNADYMQIVEYFGEYAQFETVSD